jgi:hypothetical protein
MRVLFLVSVAALCCSCSEEHGERDWRTFAVTEGDPRVSEVFEVNEGMGLAVAQVIARRQSHCKAAEAFVKPGARRAADPIAAEALRKLRLKEEAFCIVFRSTDDYRDEVIRRIVAKRSVPERQYWFAVFENSAANEDALYEPQVTGPFRTQDECDAAEGIARRAHIPTISCRRWSGNLQGTLPVR